jgi:hypothetical protein
MWALAPVVANLNRAVQPRGGIVAAVAFVRRQPRPPLFSTVLPLPFTLGGTHRGDHHPPTWVTAVFSCPDSPPDAGGRRLVFMPGICPQSRFL